MVTSVLNLALCFMSGMLLSMSSIFLFNFAEMSDHPLVARSRSPKFASALWGLAFLFLGALFLLGFDYHFALSLNTLFLFLGFSIWRIALEVMSERRERKAKGEARKTV